MIRFFSLDLSQTKLAINEFDCILVFNDCIDREKFKLKALKYETMTLLE